LVAPKVVVACTSAKNQIIDSLGHSTILSILGKTRMLM